MTVHPRLARHNAKFEPSIRTVAGRYHVAYGFSPSNCTLIEGDEGCVLVDTLPTVDFAEPVAEGFRRITDKPIRAVIYTHVHPDHISGVKAFVSDEEVRSGAVEVIALDELTDHLARDSGLLAPVLARRAMYTFGFELPRDDTGNVGSGLGPPNIPGRRSFIAPTRTFAGQEEIDVAGVRLTLIHLPSETDDQVVVWSGDDRVLLSADVIQGETFPNIYALRGTGFRNPMVWARAIDRLRRLRPETLIPHHGRPVSGAAAADGVLTAYRDAIKYLHDQTVRLINKGATPDELMEHVAMPPHLAEHEWLGEFYGSYKHSAPAIYAGYVGWFDGDPAKLDPPPRQERAARYVALMGGRDALLREARKALDDGDAQWSAELTGWLVAADTGDREARALRADALRRWGLAQANANWRNWALTAALELEDKLKPPRGLPFGLPDTVRTFPMSRMIETMTVRLRAEAALDKHVTVAFETTDTDEACALEVRRGVCQFHADPPEDADIRLRFSRAFLESTVTGGAGFPAGIAAGGVTAVGDTAAIDAFFALFETPSLEIPIVVR